MDEFIASMSQEQREQAMLDASLFRTCFETDAGKLVLDKLEQFTIEQPVVHANSTQFGAGIREGQNSIVRYIQKQIKLAREGFDE